MAQKHAKSLVPRVEPTQAIVYSERIMKFRWGPRKASVKVKNDNRSKFSNLSNWKEEAWKNQGFNRIRTRDLRDDLIHFDIQPQYKCMNY